MAEFYDGIGIEALGKVNHTVDKNDWENISYARSKLMNSIMRIFKDV